MLKKFITWIKIKSEVHFSNRLVYFRAREIWWVNLGANVGHEEEGKNKNFERPILILKKFNKHLFWAVPLTTKIKRYNIYYFQYNFGGNEYSAVLSQLRVLSNKRLIRKVGIFSSENFIKIRSEVKKLI